MNKVEKLLEKNREYQKVIYELKEHKWKKQAEVNKGISRKVMLRQNLISTKALKL